MSMSVVGNIVIEGDKASIVGENFQFFTNGTWQSQMELTPGQRLDLAGSDDWIPGYYRPVYDAGIIVEHHWSSSTGPNGSFCGLVNGMRMRIHREIEGE